MKSITSLTNKFEKLTVDKRLKFTRKTTAFFFFIGILFSLPVWTNGRFFPMVPVFEKMNAVIFPLDFILLAIIILLLLGLALFDKTILLYPLLCCLLLVLLQDQLRWQPWVYSYVLILLLFALERKSKFRFSQLNCLQILIIGIYIWSGIQKFNPSFIDNTFNTILNAFFKIENQKVIDHVHHLGYLIPLTEIFIGIALASVRLRKMGVVVAVLSHLFILSYLSPLGLNKNSVVYPWNVAMIIVVTLLFFKVKNPLVLWRHECAKMKLMNLGMVLLIWVFPLFNFFHLWDSYLSFSLYSDRTSLYYIAVQEQELNKLDKRIHKYFTPIKGLSGGQIIDIDKWANSELNIPFYPEKRVFKTLCKTFCEIGIEEDKLIFLEYAQPLKERKVHTLNCTDLN